MAVGGSAGQARGGHNDATMQRRRNDVGGRWSNRGTVDCGTVDDSLRRIFFFEGRSLVVQGSKLVVMGLWLVVGGWRLVVGSLNS